MKKSIWSYWMRKCTRRAYEQNRSSSKIFLANKFQKREAIHLNNCTRNQKYSISHKFVSVISRCISIRIKVDFCKHWIIIIKTDNKHNFTQKLTHTKFWTKK